MVHIQFPHINRKLTAGFLAVIFILAGTANLSQNQLFIADEEKKLRLLLLQNPNIGRLHEKLGQYYLGVDEKRAEKEYLLAQEYYLTFSQSTGTNVLGQESSPWQTWLNLSSKKHNLANEIKYWEKVQETYPDYLYANLKLAVLSAQAGNMKNAKNYLGFVIVKDPANQYAIKLADKLR